MRPPGRTRLHSWLHVREFAVPASMITAATARRLTGDWAGACAAAHFDVDLDLRTVNRRHGRDFTGRLRTDLRRLAPDLLRWHLPRTITDGLLRPGLTMSLIRYDSDVELVARTAPSWADHGQRISLALWDPGAADTGPHPRPRPDRRFRLDLHPHLWAADRAPELHERSGAEHWAPTPTDGGWPGHAVHRWAAEAEILRAADGCTGPVAVRLGNGHRFLIGDEAPGPRPVPACGVLPYAATWTPPDLELLHAAMISADRLHPLVAEALAPPTPDGAVRQVTVDGGVRQVECRGETHRLAVVGGRLVPLDHEPGQLRREELLTVFGGPPVPCLQLISADARNPLWLDDVRARLDHGDRAGATELVTTRLGTDVPIEGPLREAFDDAAAGLVEHGLYRAGLTGRIPPLERRDHERNRRGRTRWKPRPHRPGQHGPDIPPAWALR